MKRHAQNLVSLLLILAMMLANSAVASANDTVTLPPVSAKLTETLEKIESLMRVGNLSETNEFKKQYVDYFGGVSYFNDTVTLYTTDTNAPLIKELSSDPNIVIQKVAHSLNKLNQLSLDLVALGEAGRINGYSGPPSVNVRENRVDLSLRNDETLPNGLSSEAVMRELNADSSILNITYQAEYPTEDGAVLVPKTGDASYSIDFVIFSLVVVAVCMVLYKRVRVH
jgi:hypothetical protein